MINPALNEGMWHMCLVAASPRRLFLGADNGTEKGFMNPGVPPAMLRRYMDRTNMPTPDLYHHGHTKRFRL